MLPWVGLLCVIAAFSGHTHLLRFHVICLLKRQVSKHVFGLLKKGFENAADFVFVWVDALRPSQHFSSHVGMIPELKQLQKIKCYVQGHNTGTLVRLGPAISKS